MTNSLKNSTDSVLYLTTAMCAVFLLGCESLVDLAVDCLDYDGPEFNKALLGAPVLNQVYNETITASIDNEPRDDRYNYEFTISGQLPAGIQTDQVGRQLIFSGTATETGEFLLRVSVAVSHSNSNLDSGLCYTTESQSYQLTVLPM